MAQKSLGKVYPKIGGSNKLGFDRISFIKSSSEPSANLVEGQVFFNDNQDRLNIYNGSKWIAVGTVVGTTADLTATPTASEFSTAFGAANLAKAGFTGVVEDSSDGKNYIVVSDGTTWHYVALTAAS